MWLGSLRLDLISGGRFRVDGEALFGVVPRPLWERRFPADPDGRVAVAANCLLVRGGGFTAMIQAGPSGSAVVEGLARRGVAATGVDALILSNLHVDHAGGALVRSGETLGRAFPNAQLFVQEAALEPAREHADPGALSAAYAAYAAAAHLTAVSGEAEIRAGVTVVPLPGHSPGMQAVRIESRGQTAFYFGDALPTAAHVPLPWMMRYDAYPVELLADKKRLLDRAAAERWLCVFERDPDVPWGTIVDEVSGKRRVHPAPLDPEEG